MRNEMNFSRWGAREGLVLNPLPTTHKRIKLICDFPPGKTFYYFKWTRIPHAHSMRKQALNLGKNSAAVWVATGPKDSAEASSAVLCFTSHRIAK